MFNNLILGAFVFMASHIAATPTSPSSSSTPSPTLFAFPQLARFDNTEGTAPAVLGAPVGIYDDIKFNGMEVASNGVGGVGPVAGILPQSPPNDIGYGKLVDATIEQGTPMMTAVYPDTTVLFFDLTSFYFGCIVALQNTAADPPVPCTVTTTCVNPAGKTVATQSFVFATNGGLAQDMVQAKPIGFKGCQYVTFSTTSNNPANVDIATGLDTISYTVYSTLPLSP